MADKKITELNALTAASTDDVLPIVDSPASAAETKYISLANLATSLSPAWSTWSPSWTNLTKGSATIVAKYVQIGKFVAFRLSLTWAADTSASGDILFSLPVTANSGYTTPESIGNLSIVDATGGYYLGFIWLATTTTAQPIVSVTNGTYESVSGIPATAPMTWTTNDKLLCTGFYEAA